MLAKRIYPVHSHVKYGYRYAPLVSRQHGKAPRVAWTAFHNIQIAPPNLPRVRSSRTLTSERTLSQGAPSHVLLSSLLGGPHMSWCKPDANHGHPCDTRHIAESIADHAITAWKFTHLYQMAHTSPYHRGLDDQEQVALTSFLSCVQAWMGQHRLL